MFELVICGYHEVFKVVQEWGPTHTISLIDEMNTVIGGKYLHINVADILKPMEGFIHPEKNHLDKIFEFTKDLTDSDKLLVHCFAGQSRSTAVAIGVLIQHGMTYEEAFDKVCSLRPILLPNMLFIELIDDHFKLGGSLIEHVQYFRSGVFERTLRPPDGPNEADIDQMKKILATLNNMNNLKDDKS